MDLVLKYLQMDVYYMTECLHCDIYSVFYIRAFYILENSTAFERLVS